MSLLGTTSMLLTKHNLPSLEMLTMWTMPSLSATTAEVSPPLVIVSINAISDPCPSDNKSSTGFGGAVGSEIYIQGGSYLLPVSADCHEYALVNIGLSGAQVFAPALLKHGPLLHQQALHRF